MSRELKFRAWDNKNNKWLHGYKPGGEGCNILGEIILLGGWMSEIKLENLNDVIVEQFAGLRDKDGREIWENDMVDIGGIVYVVVYETGVAGFIGRCGNIGKYVWGELDDSRIKVIGDIHSNPELLEVSK